MTEYDFERLKDYSLLDKRFAYAPRKRVPYYERQSDYVSEESFSAEIPLIPNIDANNADFTDLMREYDTDSEKLEDREKELQMLRSQANLRPLLSQGATYLALLAFIGAFVMVVNWYNMKQLAQLKEEYGFDERKPSPEFWWRKAVIYRICIHSYQDSNGDGIGDINGIRQHLEHLSYLGVDAVLLSSVFDSPFEDFGRDVLDFMSVNRKYGSVQELEHLITELHGRGIKVLIEVVPNHTSRRHKWFIASRQGGLNNVYRNYYIWDKGVKLPNGTRVPPNNWVSRYGGSAWSFDEDRQQFYYHYYHHSMPDLNLRDNNVRLEILSVFKHWLDKGVDALYVSDVHVLYESDDLQLDEPLTDEDSKSISDSYASVKHIYTEHQPDVHDFLGSWRDFIETYSVQSRRRIGLIVDVGDSAVTEVVKYYFTGPDAPVSRALFNAREDCGGHCLHETVDSWLTHLPEDRDAIWMVNGPDHQRVSSRKGPIYQTAMNILALLLPGASISLYGDEIGLDDTHLVDGRVHQSALQNKVVVRRAVGQTPMQWTSEQQSGFTSSNQSWLPVDPQFATINVEVQKKDPTGRSPLQVYQRLAHLRKERSFIGSKIQFLIVNDNIVSFMRFARDSAPYLIALNVGNASATDDYTILTGVGQGKVVLYYGSEYKVKDGDLVNLSQLILKPGEGIVVLLVMEDDIFEKP